MAVTPFAYRRGGSVIHRAPALLKLAALFVLSIAAFSSFTGLAAAAPVIVVFSLLARVKPRELLRGCRAVFFIALFVLVCGGLRFEGIKPFLSAKGLLWGFRQGLCLLVSFAAGNLLFSTTTMAELRDNLPGNMLSLGLTLMLGFIPRFFEIWEAANLACEARACKKGPRRMTLLIPLVTELMMEKAVLTAEALEARGIGMNLAGAERKNVTADGTNKKECNH
jgi:biotin transport system permease protein